MNGLDIIDYDGTGYKSAHKFEAWRVAFLRYSEAFDKVMKLERHMETDEIFMLLEGEGALIIGDERKVVKMEKHKIYNVRRETWHNIKVSEGTKVFVVENDNTTVNNTEYQYFDEPIA